ncbi:hypothetical protein AEB_P2037 [Altererythrobacter sp. B11]|uniref:DUF3800 domain-containing protein n=1 Tax=Altererythrobacter sp. B11 TaxID=2060312 RepID=UPI000DC6F99A|nr:DUF3800 domain-containing protein [Altererythrobacter sp. B11]BBC72905.1 hypothetical protein AEB_P2037 [Altererythrobacter sp. B11]
MLIEAYVDETGINKDDIAFCVAGYMVRANAGESMATAWQDVLDRYGIDYFRTSECLGGRVEPYGSLGKARCTALATELINLIRYNCMFGFAFCFSQRNYRIIENAKGKEYPYSFAIECILSAFLAEISNLSFRPKLEVFIESGQEKNTDVRRLLKELALDARNKGQEFSYSFERKGERHLLEAADMLAWHCQKHIKRCIAGLPIRKDFAALLDINHRVFQLCNTLDPDGQPNLQSTRLYVTDGKAIGDKEAMDEIAQIYQLGSRR